MSREHAGIALEAAVTVAAAAGSRTVPRRYRPGAPHTEASAIAADPIQ
jgi:hypothetical protein